MKLRGSDMLFVSLFTDFVILNLSILLMAVLNINVFDVNIGDLGHYISQGNIILIISYYIYSNQSDTLRDGFWKEFIYTSKQALIIAAISGMVSFFILPKQFSREFIIQYCVFFYLGKVIFYGIRYQYIAYKQEKGKGTMRTLIVGINDTSRQLKMIIDKDFDFGYKFIAYVSPDAKGEEQVAGKPENIAQIIDEQNIQAVFATVSIFDNNNESLELLDICNLKGVRLWFVLENQRWLNRHINTESIGDLVLINPQRIPLDNMSARVQKRLFDVGFSLVVILFVFSWLFPIIALLIKLSSRGPVFFVQERTGANNKTFNCIKFRSMEVNSDAHERQTTYNDSRKTVIGRFLRRTNLDELPQFFNVLVGNMSVVGPRPHMLKHTLEYSNLIDYYLVRHFVKPGITGFAQVNGYRGETKEVFDMEKRVVYDRKYIEKWTLGWDIKIIWLTIFGKDVLKNAH